MNVTLLTESLSGEEDLPAFAKKLAHELHNHESFVLWLNGNLGAGKTTLTRYLFRVLGLDPAVPVTSPTYTFMNEYQIGEHWYAHLDLYRASTGFTLVELGVLDAKLFKGILVEWAEQPDAAERIEPTHILRFTILPDNRRNLVLEEVRPF